MPGETWTLDSIWLHFTTLVKELKEWLLKLLSDKEARDKERWETQEKNVAKALANLGESLAKVNEFRKMLTDLQATYIPKAEVLAIIDGLKDKIDKLEEANLKNASKGEGSHTTWILIVGIISFASLVLGIIARFQ